MLCCLAVCVIALVCGLLYRELPLTLALALPDVGLSAVLGAGARPNAYRAVVSVLRTALLVSASSVELVPLPIWQGPVLLARLDRPSLTLRGVGIRQARCPPRSRVLWRERHRAGRCHWRNWPARLAVCA